VVAISFETRKIVWRTEVRRTARRPHGDLADGHASSCPLRREQGARDRHGRREDSRQLESGDSPHENNFSRDGTRIFHASIGMVYSALRPPALDSSKGDRWFESSMRTPHVLERIDMGQSFRRRAP
jgi:hypothetical protein